MLLEPRKLLYSSRLFCSLLFILLLVLSYTCLVRGHDMSNIA